jgi:hypothetical protein
MARYAVAHLDEIDELADGRYRYRPVRHHLGITSFGATAWTAHAAGDPIINEHEEGDPSADQELFLVVRGHAVFELEGDRVDAPAGTLIFAPPRLRRRASAEEAETVIMLIEGTPGKAYEPRGWELWAPLAPLYESGKHAEVADRLGFWSKLIRSTHCCSTTWPAARASPAERPPRSSTSGARSTCPTGFVGMQSSIRTWTLSATNERSGN